MTPPQYKWAICTVTQAWCLVVISYVSYLWYCISGRASFLGFGLTDCRNVFVSLTWDYSALTTTNVEAQEKYICVDVPWHEHNARLVSVLMFVYCMSAGTSFQDAGWRSVSIWWICNHHEKRIPGRYLCGSAVTQMLRVGSVASHISAAFSGIPLPDSRNVCIFLPWWTWITGWTYICTVMPLRRCIVSVCIASVKWHICVGFHPRCRLTEWRNIMYSLPLWKWITGRDLYSCGCVVAQAWHAELCVMFVASHIYVGLLPEIRVDWLQCN